MTVPRRSRRPKSEAPAPKRGRGRPPVGGDGTETVRVEVRVPAAVHAALVAEAAKRGVSLGELVRERLERRA